MNEIQSVHDNTKQIQTFNESLGAEIKALDVKDTETLIKASDILKRIKGTIKKIKEQEAQAHAARNIKINNTVRSMEGVTSIRKTWTYEIIDESKIPLSFCEPSQKKIDAAIKAGVRDISGLRIFEKASVVSR